jgi:hypothetical protein
LKVNIESLLNDVLIKKLKLEAGDDHFGVLIEN